MKTLLIDGDSIAYPASFATDPATSAVSRVRGLMETIGAERVIIAMGCPREECFRRTLWPQYKSHRSPLPAGVPVALAALANEFPHRKIVGLEADDVLGLLATCGRIDWERIIVGNDKDLLSIPGQHFNFGKPKDGVFTVSPLEADRRHMLQTLMGDSGDGYPGCPGVGAVKAAALLTGPQETWWPNALQAYAAKGLGESDALIQARLARILRASDVDFPAEKNGTVIICPWTPEPIAAKAAA